LHQRPGACGSILSRYAGAQIEIGGRLRGGFDVGGIDLRVSTVPDFKPHEHTVLGFSVPDVATIVKALREQGVIFNTYKGFNQDDLGICSLPNSAFRVAWFNDPDGNVLSVTNA
jgi:hypothetical protein